ncbi:MAG: hypothetical protein AAB467_00425, partial [Patescibacteria group bacterium]
MSEHHQHPPEAIITGEDLLKKHQPDDKAVEKSIRLNNIRNSLSIDYLAYGDHLLEQGKETP